MVRRGEIADIRGVFVSPINMTDALDTIESWIATRSSHYVCVTGAHGVIESKSDKKLRDIHNRAGLVVPDGIPLVWLCRALGFKRTKRVYGPDLMRHLTAISAERGYRQFYYGGREGVAEKLAETLQNTHPALQVVGTHTPPFCPLTREQDDAVVEKINSSRPDVLWVGLSTPKQEYWMAEHAARLEVPIVIGIGAAFDFLSGLKSQAPIWMQRSGLEWFFRLVTEPRRLWRRYLSIIPQFVSLASQQLVRKKLYGTAIRQHSH